MSLSRARVVGLSCGGTHVNWPMTPRTPPPTHTGSARQTHFDPRQATGTARLANVTRSADDSSEGSVRRFSGLSSIDRGPGETIFRTCARRLSDNGSVYRPGLNGPSMRPMVDEASHRTLGNTASEPSLAFARCHATAAPSRAPARRLRVTGKLSAGHLTAQRFIDFFRSFFLRQKGQWIVDHKRVRPFYCWDHSVAVESLMFLMFFVCEIWSYRFGEVSGQNGLV